jgi:beta-glucosidase
MPDGPRLPRLPPGFVWGASTAAYQIEGAVSEDGRGPSIWDAFVREPGKIRNGETGDVAADHYHRYRDDVRLAAELGLAAYRFSVSWPRVLPEGVGAPNEKGLDFYDRLIDELLAHGVEPWLCLYHWDLPLALHQRGGWTVRDSAGWFADYSSLIAGRFGDRVARWATFNEPGVFTLAGYASGRHAPGLADFGALSAAAHNVNRAHGAAVQAIRTRSRAPIGVVCNQQPARPASPAPADHAAAQLFDLFWNRAFADPMILGGYQAGLAALFEAHVEADDLSAIRQPLDFLGLNHYSPNYVRSDPDAPGGIALAPPPAGAPVTMMGWEISPQAFVDTLVGEHARYALPIVVTENGVALRDRIEADGSVNDSARIEYLSLYIGAIADAIRAGAHVDGYFVWSLIDNFEWAEGYEPRFGLVHVDYETLKRTQKASYHWLAAELRRSRESHPIEARGS